MIPENSDLRTVSEVVKTKILLLHHPQRVAASVVYPDVRVASLIIVV